MFAPEERATEIAQRPDTWAATGTHIEDLPCTKTRPAIKPVIIFEFVNFHPLAIAGWLHLQRHGPAEWRGGVSSLRDNSGTSVHRREESPEKAE